MQNITSPPQANAEVAINENFVSVDPAALYGIRQPATTGLTFAYYGGIFNGFTIANGTVTLTNTATNYVVAERSTGTVSASTATTNWIDDVNYLQIGVGVASGGVFTWTDHRQAYGGTGGASGVFTQTLDTASPNATVNVASLTISGGSTNVDAVLRPKGTGSLLAQVPDSTTAGGNKRGTNAVDLQMVRSAATQVASGNRSFAAGENNTASAVAAAAVGYGNTASQNYTYAFGRDNSAAATDCMALGHLNTSGTNLFAYTFGASNTASGDSSMAVGKSNTASGANSFAAGTSNTASGVRSFVAGYFGTTRGLIGYNVLSSGARGTLGRTQVSFMQLALETANATPAILTSNAAAAASTNQLVIPVSSVFLVKGTVTAFENATGDTKGWEFSALLKHVSGGTVSLVAAVTPVVVAADAGAAAWTVSVTANNTTKCLSVEVTGEASHTIDWMCNLETSEMVAV